MQYIKVNMDQLRIPTNYALKSKSKQHYISNKINFLRMETK